MGTYQKDRGYSWVIAVAAFSVSFFQWGVVKVFGVLIPHLVEQLDMSTWAAGMVASTGMGLRSVLGPVWTVMNNVMSYRWQMVIGGFLSSLGLFLLALSKNALHLGLTMVVVSIGHGLLTVSKVVAINDYFEAKFSLANGIAFTGGAVGFIVLAPLTEYLISIYGWRGAVILFAAMNMNCCVAGALMVKPRTESYVDEHRNDHRTTRYRPIGDDSETETPGNICTMNGIETTGNTHRTKTESNSCFSNLLDMFGFSVLSKYPIFTVYLIAMLLHEIVLSAWVLFLVSYTITLGYSNQTASFLSAVGGCGSLMGLLILGPFIDEGYISGRMMFCLLAVGGAITMACYPFTDVYWILVVFSFTAGFFLASTIPIFIVMIKEMINKDSGDFSGAIGLQFFTRGIGMLSGGPITGLLYDLTCSFNMAFIALGALECLAALLTLVRPSFLVQSS